MRQNNHHGRHWKKMQPPTLCRTASPLIRLRHCLPIVGQCMQRSWDMLHLQRFRRVWLGDLDPLA